MTGEQDIIHDPSAVLPAVAKTVLPILFEIGAVIPFAIVGSLLLFAVIDMVNRKPPKH